MQQGSRPLADYLLFVQCLALMVAMALAVRLLPFARLKALASFPLGARSPDNASQELVIRRTRWAIAAAARRSPFRAMCFEKGLVAQLVLRRQGIDSALYYGLAKGEHTPLHAHVRVSVGDLPVCGVANAGNFASLLRLPPGHGC